MTDLNLGSPDDRLATAGEYVLGTLTAADMPAFEAILRNDPALQRDVYRWQDRLLALSSRAAPVDPSPVVWQRIDVEVEARAASARPSRQSPATPDLPWWRRARPWQAIGGLALASTALMAVLLVERTQSPPRDHYLAVLQSPADRANGWIVDVEAGQLRLMPVSATAAVPVGRSLQFWTKPQGAAGPTSLGLVRAGEPLKMPTSRLPGVGEQQLFEITLEPEGGSTIGKPTGPVLFVGRTVHL